MEFCLQQQLLLSPCNIATSLLNRNYSAFLNPKVCHIGFFHFHSQSPFTLEKLGASWHHGHQDMTEASTIIITYDS